MASRRANVSVCAEVAREVGEIHELALGELARVVAPPLTRRVPARPALAAR
ncbi:MAG: hypothetical protein ACRDZ4_15460 [Egibacteraceae bacterium]